ncbi:MAG: type 4a pilus biogenesis protein PilO [Candidatus Omnitrophota bacterium]
MNAQKLVNKFNKLKLSNKKIGLGILIALLVIYADFSFVIKSQLRGIKNAEVRITKLKSDIQNLNSGLARLGALKAKESAGKGSFKARRLITEDEITALIEVISAMANKESIRLMQIKPQKMPLPKDTALKEADKSLLINLEMTCGYHSLGKFLNNIENAEVLMSIDSIKVSNDSADYLKQKVSLLLRTYVKK